MKEFHIITVGNSLLSNFLRTNEEYKNVKMGDEEFWRKKYEDRNFFKELLNFLEENPRKHSAEMNSLLAYIEKRGVPPENITVYLSGTKTASNEIIQNALTAYLKETGMEILSPKEVSGLPLYPHEKKIVAEFQRDLSNLLDTFLSLAKRKKEEGFKVVFNPTGGYKPHVITCALAGFMTRNEVYYIHEELKELIIIPPMFYFPREGEIDLLNELKELTKKKGTVRGKYFDSLMNRFGKSVDRLVEYGLIELESKPGEKPYGMKITSRGEWALDYYEKLREIEVKVR